MSYIQFLGNGKGYIYATNPDATKTIVYIEPNTTQGVRNMRVAGAASAPIIAARSAIGTVTFTGVAAGNITAITINAVNQLAAPVAADPVSTVLTAVAVAAAINAYAPSGYTFTAEAIGAVVNIYSTPSDGVAVNGLTITTTVSNPAITTTTTAFTGGSDQTGVYDTSVGLRFYLDPSISASKTALNINAEDISSYIVVRGLQSGIFTELLSVTASAQLLNITRCSAFTNILADTFSSTPQTDLAFINTNGFVQGDVIRLSQQVAGRVVTLIDANVWGSAPSNIYLTDQTPFNCQDNKSIELRLQYDNTLGSIWIENGRSISQGYISISRSNMIILINNNNVAIGQDYLIQGAGLQGGVLVQGVALNAITQSGQFVSYVPDYQNLSGVFAGVWTSKLPSVVVGNLYAWNGVMYEALTTTTGTDPGSDPNYAIVFDTDPRYVQEIDNVQYNVFNNSIVKREDGRGNVVYGSTAIAFFKWGADNCYGNIITEGSFAACNVTGDFISNIISNTQSTFLALTSEFVGNTFSNILFLANNANSLSVKYNNFQGDASLPTIYSFIDQASLSSNFVNVTNNRMSVRVSVSFYVSGNQTITSNTFTGEVFGFYTNGFSVSNSVVNSVFQISAWLSKAFTAEIINSSVSTYSTIVDLDLCMTGTTLDLQGIVFGSGSDPYISGEWILTSASGGYTIDKIIASVPQPILYTLLFPVKLSSSAGTTNYISPTAIGSAVVGQFISQNTGVIDLVGRAQGSDYVTFHVNPSAGQVLEIVDTGLYNLLPAGTPTLQAVLDFDHSLINGYVTLGTGTGGALPPSVSDVVAIGTNAANNNSNSNIVAIGENALSQNTGDVNVAIGLDAALNCTGNNLIAIGQDSAPAFADANAIAIGRESLMPQLGVPADNAIAIGPNTFDSSAGSINNSIAIGVSAGSASNFAANSVFIGTQAGNQSASSNSVAIGSNAGQLASGGNKVAIGINAGYNNDGNSNVSIGVSAGYGALVSAYECVNLGQQAGFSNQGYYGVFLSTNAGLSNTGNITTGIGPGAAQSNSGNNVVAIGNSAGKQNTGGSTVAIGVEAGKENTAIGLVAIGYQAGYQNTAVDGIIAIGSSAAYTNTGTTAVIAIGPNAAYNNTGEYVTAIGLSAAASNIGLSQIVAIGYSAASGNQGADVVAIGDGAASSNSGSQVIAIGNGAANSNANANVIAIGEQAANSNSGSDVVAIGKNAGFANTLSSVFILSNNELPSFLDFTVASAVLGAGVSGSTYLYHDQTTNSIGAVRIP